MSNTKHTPELKTYRDALIEAKSTIEYLRDNPKKFISKVSVQMSLAAIEKAIKKQQNE